MISPYIKKITVENLWDSIQLSAEFREDATIFIGSNGSYKSTLLDLLSAALREDYGTLSNYVFSRIIITLDWDEAKELIITREKKKKGLHFTCKAGQLAESNVSIPEDLLRIGMFPGKEHAHVASKISERLEISWLPELRTARSSRQKGIHSPDAPPTGNPINQKLSQLKDRLAHYLLELNKQNNVNIETLRKDILEQLLFGSVTEAAEDNLQIQYEDIEKTRVYLHELFSEMNLSREMVTQLMQRLEALRLDLSAGRPHGEEVSQLYYRTRKLVEVFALFDSARKRIFRHAYLFIDILNDFMPDKEFSLGNEKEILDITLKGTSTHLDITALSSGEKQLIVLLAEALLQVDKPGLLIADEPELSLHIRWQREILRAILRVNPAMQIVVATHAPEIAAAFPENLVNMKSVRTHD